MGAKDYYQILGVGDNASQEEIKRTYRNLAKQYHPDANPGNKQAEERFKEISEAYDMLGDPKKRQKYDQMRRFGMGGQGFDFGNFDFRGFQGRGQRGGTRGFTFEGSDFFGSFGDIFSQIFDFGERTRQKQYGPRRGEDVHIDVTIPLELAVQGGKTQFGIEKEKTCSSCQGGGAKPGSQVQTCGECHGKGMITIGQGGFGVSRPCPRCYGRGQIIKNPCDRCHGTGKVRGKRNYSVKIPMGIEDGRQIRLRGQGNTGIAGGKPGDIIVHIRIQPHRFFRRRGNDIVCDIPLTLKQAVHGTKIRIKTVKGQKVELRIPQGTSDGTSFKMKGLGISQNGCKGDQYVTVHVQVPDHPSREEEALLDQLRKMQ